MRTLVCGDIHGGYEALLQVLGRAKYQKEEDRLIVLGDVVDGWPQSREVMDYLMGIENAVFLIGNHDWWYFDWLKSGWNDYNWMSQGGRATWISMAQVGDRYKQQEHWEPYLDRVQYYYVEDGRAFVHAGFNPKLGLLETPQDELIWSRDLFLSAIAEQQFADQNDLPRPNLTGFREVYIGHTTTTRFSDVPVQKCEVWMLDQGAGWEGKLSVMDINTKEYWQSDKVSDFYPGTRGRR